MSVPTGGEEVASLFASLGLNIDNAAFALGTSKISEMQERMKRLQDAGASFSTGRRRRSRRRVPAPPPLGWPAALGDRSCRSALWAAQAGGSGAMGPCSGAGARRGSA